MHYKSLHDLINLSSSTRIYFLSLPVEMQMQLHQYNDIIHSAHDLHKLVDIIPKYNHKVRLTDMLM